MTTLRYGQLRLRGLFQVQTSDPMVAGDVCVARTPRGHELGTVLATPVEPTEAKVGCGESACGSCATTQGEILRLATREDRQAFKEVESAGIRKELEYTRRKVREMQLPMKISGAEYLLRKEKLILHFASEHRVDFRELVRELAKEFKTRIELKQIRARDEEARTGDMAPGGRQR